MNMRVIAAGFIARRSGTAVIAPELLKDEKMTQTIEETNKRFVLEAFDTLFNKRDYQAAERFGRRATSSTAPTSRQAGRACST
jgi:hypothetical protein